MTEDYYDILGVSNDASQDEIKSEYKKLSKKYHPDNIKTGNAERFKKISEAYSTLICPHSRKEYDETKWFNFESQSDKIFFDVLLNTIGECKLEQLETENLAKTIKEKIDNMISDIDRKFHFEKKRHERYINKLEKLIKVLRSTDGRWQSIYTKLLQREKKLSYQHMDKVELSYKQQKNVLAECHIFADSFESFVSDPHAPDASLDELFIPKPKHWIA